MSVLDLASRLELLKSASLAPVFLDTMSDELDAAVTFESPPTVTVAVVAPPPPSPPPTPPSWPGHQPPSWPGHQGITVNGQGSVILIVCLVTGGVFVLCVGALAAWFCYCRRKESSVEDELSDDSARKGGLSTTGAKDAQSRGSVGSVSGRIGPDGVMEARSRTSVGGVQRVTDASAGRPTLPLSERDSCAQSSEAAASQSSSRPGSMMSASL